MHSRALLLSLFAAGAIASPVYRVKRDIVTEVDVVTTVVYVTETEGVPHHTKHTKPVHPVTVVTKTVGGDEPDWTNFPWGGPGGPGGHHGPWTGRPTEEPTQEPTTYSTEAPTSSAPPPEEPTTTSTSTPTHTPAPKPKPADPYQAAVVHHHNIHRFNHSASAIQWDDGLASTAMKIAQTCVYEHNTDMDGGGYGQNIAAGVSADDIATVITDLFYNGEINAFGDQYGVADPVGFESWGHFSQVVWKGTSHVACASYDCSASGLANVGSDVSPVFTVCNYADAGNYAGEYGTNIGEPLGHATVMVSQ